MKKYQIVTLNYLPIYLCDRNDSSDSCDSSDSNDSSDSRAMSDSNDSSDKIIPLPFFVMIIYYFIFVGP